MAKKVILKDWDNVEILPITRGELVTDSSGNPAFHSSLFLATDSLPGLMSAEDKIIIDNLGNNGPDFKVNQILTTTDTLYRLLFSYTDDDLDRVEEARKSSNLTFNPYTGVLTSSFFLGNVDGTNIYRLTDYIKQNDIYEIKAEDSLNTALGKLEYKADLGVMAYNWYRSVTNTDTDTYINKWLEILDFLNNVNSGTNIIDEFVTRKTTQEITGTKTFTQAITITTEETAPLLINSTILINNLNADLLDGFHANSFMNFSTQDDHIKAIFLMDSMNQIASGTGYIKFCDESENWFNSKWGSVIAIEGFIKNGSSNDKILLGGGGDKDISDFLLKSEELTNNVTIIEKTFTVTLDWMDTDILGTSLTTGTYIIQVTANTSTMSNCSWSGIMSWYSDITNGTESDEIILHRAGASYSNTIYLRTIMTNGSLKLLIAANTSLASATYTFKFKRIL